MKLFAFTTRNRKEILRDPLSLVFGIGFPVVLLLLITLMKHSIKNMPADVFPIEGFAPGMAVFGLSFLSLFLGTLITNDRNSSLLMRLFASPLTGADYIIGYTLPLLPAAVLQSAVCFLVAVLLGLEFSINLLVAILVIIPVAVLFISLGLLMGSILSNSQQVGGFGSVLINVAAWLSGTWFSLDMIGGVFRSICYALPFAHAVDAVEAAVTGSFDKILPHLLWVLGYALAIYIIAVLCFRKKMKG